MAPDALVDVRTLSLAYASDTGSREIFREVSFAVPAGEVLGIFGPNGSGKTSLLRSIAALVTPTDGNVWIADRQGRTPISLVPQDCPASFLKNVSLRRNLEWIVPGSSAFARKFLAEIEYNLDLGLRPPQCSGGMLQLVAIIRALAAQPTVVLGDEPFSNLDVNVSRRVKAAFRKAIRSTRCAAIVVLHNLDDMVDLCDRVLVIPGRPFSTSVDSHSAQAVVLSNAHVGTLMAAASPDQTFVELARRVLEAPAARRELDR